MVTWREGTRGKMNSRFIALRVRPANIQLRRAAHDNREELPVRWLICEWPSKAAEPTTYWLSSLPAETPLKDLVRLGKLRWRIEHDYREDALGLDHFEGRTYRGWNHHVTLVSTAHAFLTPGATTAPANQRGGLTLFQLVRELQALLDCWHGPCAACRRELPPTHPLRAPPT